MLQCKDRKPVWILTDTRAAWQCATNSFPVSLIIKSGAIWVHDYQPITVKELKQEAIYPLHAVWIHDRQPIIVKKNSTRSIVSTSMLTLTKLSHKTGQRPVPLRCCLMLVCVLLVVNTVWTVCLPMALQRSLWSKCCLSCSRIQFINVYIKVCKVLLCLFM